MESSSIPQLVSGHSSFLSGTMEMTLAAEWGWNQHLAICHERVPHSAHPPALAAAVDASSSKHVLIFSVLIIVSFNLAISSASLGVGSTCSGLAGRF